VARSLIILNLGAGNAPQIPSLSTPQAWLNTNSNENFLNLMGMGLRPVNSIQPERLWRAS